MDRMEQKVCVTLSANNWAKVVAAVATSPLTLEEKEVVNSTIYDSVIENDHLLHR